MRPFKSLIALIAFCAITILLCLQIKEAKAVDLRDYFPTSGTLVYEDGFGNTVTAATFDTKQYSGKYKKLWPSKKKGCHIRRWGKHKLVNGQFKVIAVQPLLVCKDKSITEMGGYRDRKVISYSKGGSGSGLAWSGSGGFGYNPSTNYVNIKTNGNEVGKAYSRSRLLYTLDSFVVKGKVYNDVIVMMFEHGTKNAKKVHCPGLQSHGQYNSYTSVFWMARGIGIIQQIVVSIEDGKTYWGGENCTGNMFKGGDSYITYLKN